MRTRGSSELKARRTRKDCVLGTIRPERRGAALHIGCVCVSVGGEFHVHAMTWNDNKRSEAVVFIDILWIMLTGIVAPLGRLY